MLKSLLLIFALLAISPPLAAAQSQSAAAIFLWPNGAPGSEGKTTPESVRLTPQGEHIVSSVNQPSIAPYIPATDKATSAAVIVVPGGGHRELWMDHEGYRVGQWLSDRGIAAFVLKYRLAHQTGSSYTIEGNELPDLQRAIRLVRAHVRDWGIAPERIGVIGFSAGGELAALAATRFVAGKPDALDPIDRESSKPDFAGLIYPGNPKGMTPTSDTPPIFLLCGAEDDPSISEGVPQLYLALKQARVSAELHVLAGVGHGFGIRDSNPPEISQWPALFYTWLGARGFLKA